MTTTTTTTTTTSPGVLPLLLLFLMLLLGAAASESFSPRLAAASLTPPHTTVDAQESCPDIFPSYDVTPTPIKARSHVEITVVVPPHATSRSRQPTVTQTIHEIVTAFAQAYKPCNITVTGTPPPSVTTVFPPCWSDGTAQSTITKTVYTTEVPPCEHVFCHDYTTTLTSYSIVHIPPYWTGCCRTATTITETPAVTTISPHCWTMPFTTYTKTSTPYTIVASDCCTRDCPTEMTLIRTLWSHPINPLCQPEWCGKRVDYGCTVDYWCNNQ